MSTILDTIIAAKKKEIGERKALGSIGQFEKEGIFRERLSRSLVQGLLTPGSTGIIAEFKRKSPSKGWFKAKELEAEPVIRSYNANGAAGISVLTDDEFFGGDLNDLTQASMVSGVPVLRKDFIVDQWQIAEAKAFGADVILLIAACLTREEVKRFAGYAKSIGLEVLLEIHDAGELDHITDEVDMVGVNNRNLKTFEVDIHASLSLIDHVPANKPAVAESGINNVETIVTLREAGFKGFLIGETFMKEADPAIAFADFVTRLKAKST